MLDTHQTTCILCDACTMQCTQHAWRTPNNMRTVWRVHHAVYTTCLTHTKQHAYCVTCAPCSVHNMHAMWHMHNATHALEGQRRSNKESRCSRGLWSISLFNEQRGLGLLLYSVLDLVIWLLLFFILFWEMRSFNVFTYKKSSLYLLCLCFLGLLRTSGDLPSDTSGQNLHTSRCQWQDYVR